MFETVVPEHVRPRSRKVFYETLPVSLAIHAIAAGAILVGATWNVEFPDQSPKMFMSYSLVEPPPPPPPPPAPPTPRKAPVVPTLKPVVAKMPLVAPTIIPDLIPEVVPMVEEAPQPVEPIASPVGEPQGVEGGVEGGEIGGTTGGVTGGLKTLPLPDTVFFERDAPLPMPAVAQEFPQYPEHALTRGWQDVLVVRYIIDKKGRVREVTVLQHPEREDFTRATVNKIKHWRFQPFKDDKGKLKEVVHELTVEFKIVRRASSR